MYRVLDWDKHFENNRTRELKKLDWVPFPNKHDGDGYTELLDHENGAAHYGAWCAIVQVASKCDPRGTLLRDGARPHDARSLARMTRIDEGVMAEAIVRLVGEVKWLEYVPDPVTPSIDTPIPHHAAEIPHPTAEKRLWKGREGKGMEEKGREGCDEAATPPSSPHADAASVCFPEFPCAAGRRSKDRTWHLSEALMAELAEAFPAVDVLAEARKAHAWVIANLERRKTSRGMPSFLNRWMTKVQDRGGSKVVGSALDRIGTKEDARTYSAYGATE